MNRLGHNSAGVTITIEVRLFNSLANYGGPGGNVKRLELPAGSTVGDILDRLAVPRHEVFLVLRNGKDVTKRLNAPVDTDAFLDEGDVIALSGPVPYSWGYGAPVV